MRLIVKSKINPTDDENRFNSGLVRLIAELRREYYGIHLSFNSGLVRLIVDPLFNPYRKLFSFNSGLVRLIDPKGAIGVHNDIVSIPVWCD